MPPIQYADHHSAPSEDDAAPSAVKSDRRTGATWMAATGAFLIVAAAIVFVAVRWGSIPSAAKLSALIVITLASIVGGTRLAKALPGVGGVLVHLGAFLVPVDLVALSIWHRHFAWESTLLITSLVSTGLFVLLAARSGSTVLRWGARVGAVGIALGLSSAWGISPALMLGVAAIVLVADRRCTNDGLAIALIAGAWPGLIAIGSVFPFDAEILKRVGLHTVPDWRISVATGAMLWLSMAWHGRRTESVVTVGLGFAAFVAQASSGALAAGFSSEHVPLACAAAVLVIQVLGALAQADPFFDSIAKVIFPKVDWFGAVLTTCGSVAVLIAHNLAPSQANVPMAATFTLSTIAIGIGFLVSFHAMPRQAREAIVSLAFIALAIAAMPERPHIAIGIAGILACWSVLTRRPALSLLAVLMVWLGQFAPGMPLAAAAAAAFLVMTAALYFGDRDDRLAQAIALGAVAMLIVTTAQFGIDLAVPSFALISWGTAALLSHRVPASATNYRTGLCAAPAAIPILITDAHMTGALGAALLITSLLVFECLRLRSSDIGFFAAVAGAQSVWVALLALGWSASSAAFVVIAVGGGCLLSSSAITEILRASTMLVSKLAMVGGFVAILMTNTSLIPAAMALLGVIAASYGLLYKQARVAWRGVAGISGAVNLECTIRNVGYWEPYVAALFMPMLVAGVLTRRNRPETSSWKAYGIPLAFLLLTPIVQRIGGGASAHALIAGVSAVVAVGVGATRRLAAPLYLGTGAIVSVTLWETMDVAAGMPAWMWMAVGGSALISGAVILERRDASTIQSGRRMLLEVKEHFV